MIQCFLESTIARNRELIEVAFNAHRNQILGPNTYVIDMDAVVENAKKLKKEADKQGLSLYMMTKQFGRNPEIAKQVARVGINKAVAVDPWEALHLNHHGIELGHVGHLVQIPTKLLSQVVKCKPEVITVFTVEMAKEINQIALKLGHVQKIILKVYENGDVLYEGQSGGVSLTEISSFTDAVRKCDNIKLVGVTAFPSLLYNEDSQSVEPTENAGTVLKAKEILTELGIDIEHVNLPSLTCCESISLLSELGATHGEPGHALTGTTPSHADGSGSEIPAMVYLSEVSHCDAEKIYTYGGGFYSRSRMSKALVGNTYNEFLNSRYEVILSSAESIDYYGALKQSEGHVKKRRHRCLCI